MTELESLIRLVGDVLSLPRVGIAFLFVLGGLVGRWLVIRFTNRVIAKVTSRSKTDVDDQIARALERPVGWAVLAMGFYMGAQTFQPEEYVQEWLDRGLGLAISVLLAWLMLRMVDVLTGVIHRWAQKTDSALDDQLVPLVSKAAKATVAILGALLVLQNMGYSISGVIAGLGVGGLAVALAAQKTLSDLFGSIMLLVDRPFTVGHWVKSPDGALEGVVEEVGFRSTRIRTFERTLVSVPNSRLAEFIIDNMALRPTRRVWITVGLTYETSSSEMESALAAIKEILATHDGVDQEFYLVRFTDFGSSSLDIMVYYFSRSIDWDTYLSVREDVNLKIMDALEKLGLSIAFPTRTVHLAADELTPRLPGPEAE